MSLVILYNCKIQKIFKPTILNDKVVKNNNNNNNNNSNYNNNNNNNNREEGIKMVRKRKYKNK